RVTAAPRSSPSTPRSRETDGVLLDQALDLLGEAKRPLIIAGPAMGRGRRWSEIERLSELTGIPALLMESPRGVNDPSLRGATRAAWDELRRSPATPLHPLRVCAAIQPRLEAGGILVSDGGEFGQWCQAGLEARHRLINGPAGSIGSAVPMALGAKLARPDLPVIATLGDGTFGFHALEFDTAVRHGIPIVAVVGNDARWNAEHQLQVQHYGAARAVGCALLPTRYDRVVEALGGHGERVERADELTPALERATRSGRPACVDVVIDGVAAPSFSGSAGH